MYMTIIGLVVDKKFTIFLFLTISPLRYSFVKHILAQISKVLVYYLVTLGTRLKVKTWPSLANLNLLVLANS